MAFDELTQFLQSAADADELLRLEEPVNARYELAAVAERLGRTLAGRGPLLLFENVTGQSMPVVTNLLGHRPRLLRALGVTDLDEAVSRLTNLFHPLAGPRNWTDALKSGTAGDGSRFAPRVVRRGLCQQVVKLGRDLSLDALPIPHCWDRETNRTLTAGQTVLAGLDGRRHLGGDTAEVVDAETLLLHWTAQDEGARIFREFQQANRQMPVAVALGGDPLLEYVAGLPLPRGIDPWLFAGVLRNENVNLVRARSVELDVPAEAELVLEGYIDPVPPTGTGRVANRIGFVTKNQNLPLVRLTAITHRANPIFPVTIRSSEYRDDAACAELTERLLLALLKMLIPQVHALCLPACGSQRQAVFVSLNDDHPDTVQQVRHAIGSLPVLSLAKWIVLVDAAVDLRDPDAVWRDVCRYADLTRDVALDRGASDPCDPLTADDGTGRKLVIDATRRSLSTGASFQPAVASTETGQQVLKFIQNLGLSGE
jgi:4-hydroxy-3-polyprenylbenzoate decarboxylase